MPKRTTDASRRSRGTAGTPPGGTKTLAAGRRKAGARGPIKPARGEDSTPMERRRIERMRRELETAWEHERMIRERGGDPYWAKRFFSEFAP